MTARNRVELTVRKGETVIAIESDILPPVEMLAQIMKLAGSLKKE